MGILGSIIHAGMSIILIIMMLHSLWVGDGQAAGRAFVVWIVFLVIAFVGALFEEIGDGVLYLLATIAGAVVVLWMW